MATTSPSVRDSGSEKRPSFRIESNGNVVKIRLERESPPPGEYRSAVRIGPGENNKNEEYGGGYGSGGDSGTCSDLEGSSPPPGETYLEEARSISSSSSTWSSSSSSRRIRPLVQECTYPERSLEPAPLHHADSFYNFHLNEHRLPEKGGYEDTFAGKKYVNGDASTAAIKSANGTIRGVKNRVKHGIATFLRMNDTKWWQEKEAGKVVVYTTTMGIVRSTMQRCLKVRHILRTHLVKYTEKDLFMSRELQAELSHRLQTPLTDIPLPQVFVEGHLIGDADTIEKLNESGELRTMLKPYKSMEACTTCQVCGGYRLLPCGLCNGSKKSMHRNHFTADFFALKCMNCDEVGLVKCYNC